MNILTVDDDPDIIGFIKQITRQWGYNPNSAATAAEALSFFQKKNFDLVLLDIFLPDTMGHELIPKFRELNNEIKIITMTGENTRELELEVRAQGILYYMIKPIEINDLKTLLEHVNLNLKR